jgi:DNA-binding IclR family transcriptional regulator
MLVLDSVAPGTDFYLRVTPGSLLCAHANAFGKAVLAFLPAERVQDILAAGMPALTEHTHTSPNALVRELAATRRSGLSYDREEYSKGIYCVGAPVFDVQGAIVAGLGITGLASRRTAAMDRRLRSLVLDCAATVSADMGYTGGQFVTWKSQ